MIEVIYKKRVVAVLVLSLFLLPLYVFFRNMDLDQYPELNSCLRASVSKNILCTQNQDYVKLKNISKNVIQSIITSEDDKFYFHKGFDWKEFRASVAVNLRAFSFIRGGSTITQQLVKNVYLSQEKSINRKIKEAVLASQIEGKYSKTFILEKYLNAIEFGSNIWGIKKASQYYFSKEPKDLKILEGAYLAVLLPSPKHYSKSFDEKKLTPYLKKRIKTILYRLKRKKYVDEVDYAVALENLDAFPWNQETIINMELYDFESDIKDTKNNEELGKIETEKIEVNKVPEEELEKGSEVENNLDLEEKKTSTLIDQP